MTRSFSTGDNPELVNYLDLIGDQETTGNETVSLDGAVEHDFRTVLYYLNESRLSDAPTKRSEQLGKLNKSISSRGERAYLAVVKPGLLEVAPIRLGETQPEWKEYEANSSDAINFYSNLVHGNIPGQESDDPDLVFDEMYKLLLTGVDRIASQIGKDNVLSLVGRALFFRFLCDRDIVTEADTHNICSRASELKACFDDAENSYETSRWLDQTFNGHFLPLRERGTRQFFDDLNRSTIVFTNLSAIIRGLEPVGESQYQYKFDWAIFDFAHVPVGLLSQVYEAFSWKWDRKDAEETSVHYTPRNIALTLVEEAFEGLENPVDARILDPACGAGVFLVLAFRRLYTEHWRASGTRPNTQVIRQILEQQLCGFDISESALRLAALSLYLTAIELDPDPIPPEKLKFKDLNDLVLFNQRRQSDAVSGPVVGSLRPDVGKRFDSKFDLVLCNPPWSKIDDVRVVSELDAASKQIVSRKDESLGHAYQNPRGEPDLPFLWKATEWCRPNGQIAMVLPSRILFRQGDVATQARTALFRQIRFTGIVNCSNVRKTNVWPDMDQPFMLAFARNERPESDSTFWFISPQADYSLNQLGEIRIDAPRRISKVHVGDFERI
ncbi:MAG: N-6 DNA methylase [Planctomycetes bacterium]|nr:N-6 DNA methylase [Planctomycetota bacterium]